MARRKTTNTNELRFSVFANDNFRCRACGLYDPTGWNLQADHVHDEATHGHTTDPQDFQCLCGSCNNRKGVLAIGWLTRQPTMDLTQTIAQAIGNRATLLVRFDMILENAKEERAKVKRQAINEAIDRTTERREKETKRKIINNLVKEFGESVGSRIWCESSSK